MSGSQGANLTEGGDVFTEFGKNAGAGSQLIQLLSAEDIVPGSPASYQLCKTIYAYSVLGAKMTETPVNMAQSQEREIIIPDGPEERLLHAFRKEWKALRADTWISNTMITARIYGIASLIIGDRKDVEGNGNPLPLERLHEIDPYFSTMDPLNTAGSLVLDQNPNSPDFQKPKSVRVGDVIYHPSRTVVVMNERPIYIEWSNAAFGFVGRSVYQRALYPLKTFTQSMITDQWVTLKVGLLIAKQKAPGSVINQRIANFFGFKRSQLKSGVTGNVLTIGLEDDISSLNFQNLEGPAKFARDNALKNIAMAAGMPAKLLEQEEMIGGGGLGAEGSEDAKQIARYIDRLRIEMDPLYTFFDTIVQRRAWSPDFYRALQKDIPEYRRVPYETAFYQWKNSFQAKWPNLLSEPESKQAEKDKARFESVVALVESLINAGIDPGNKAAIISWAVDEINSRRDLFSSQLEIDQVALENYEPPAGAAMGKEDEPAAFSPRT